MKISLSLPLALCGGLLLAGCPAPGGDAAPPADAPAQPAEPVAAAPEPLSLEQAMQKVAVPAPDNTSKVPDTARVVMTTSRGPITLELNGKKAPLHTRSFLHLTNLGFYDGTVFHRHADLTGDGKGFIIQGGDPLTRVAGAEQYAGQGGPGYNVALEKNGLKHEKLVLAAARSQDPNSAGSQFYITQGATHFLDNQYTVFGKVVDGADTALALKQGDKIESVKVVEPKPKG